MQWFLLGLREATSWLFSNKHRPRTSILSTTTAVCQACSIVATANGSAHRKSTLKNGKLYHTFPHVSGCACANTTAGMQARIPGMNEKPKLALENSMRVHCSSILPSVWKDGVYHMQYLALSLRARRMTQNNGTQHNAFHRGLKKPTAPPCKLSALVLARPKRKTVWGVVPSPGSVYLSVRLSVRSVRLTTLSACSPSHTTTVVLKPVLEKNPRYPWPPLIRARLPGWSQTASVLRGRLGFPGFP
jgi:hypothetical protein